VFISPSNKWGSGNISFALFHSISDTSISLLGHSNESFILGLLPNNEFSFGGNKSSVHCSPCFGDV